MYNRLKELLEQVLLEFDPKDERFGRKAKNIKASLAKLDTRLTDRRRQNRFGTEKQVKKAGNRALARGGETRIKKRIKIIGPKGKLPK